MKVIKNNYKEQVLRIKCDNCNSILEATPMDLYPAPGPFKKGKYRVYCPLCDEPININKEKISGEFLKKAMHNAHFSNDM